MNPPLTAGFIKLILRLRTLSLFQKATDGLSQESTVVIPSRIAYLVNWATLSNSSFPMRFRRCVFHRFGADLKLPGDLLGSVAFGHQLGDLSLAGEKDEFPSDQCWSLPPRRRRKRLELRYSLFCMTVRTARASSSKADVLTT